MKQKPRKMPLHQLLVDRGLCIDEKDARSWIMAGKVIVDDQRIDKAGQSVPETANVRLKGLSKYVGKGGFKLEGALSDFSIDVSGKVALDAGAATGGFTDCLLQNGASKVYSVDVGFGALVGKLRNDERVVNLERTNISDIQPGHLNPQPALGTVDLSYLSLKKGIPIFSSLLEPDGELICLVKPLFEVSDSKARRTGKIAKTSHYSDMLRDLLRFVDSIGLQTCGLTHSHIPGGKGTLEFFLHLSKTLSSPSHDFDIEAVVDAALLLRT
jgi:23S rRNA (cytidine1920-2'-O)/16S rRNA (cytidine1409-2'-O)-methyltransferase